MKVGIKVGPEDYIPIFKQSKAKYCEVWYRLDWQDKYRSLFNYLNKNKINFGLHFWAMIDNKYYPNLLYIKGDIAKKSYNLLIKTIEIASKYKAKYVNFHPASYRLILLDLNKSKMKLVHPNEPINRQKSFKQLLTYLKGIQNFADKKNIIPFVETVPKYDPSDFREQHMGRLKALKTEGLETEKYFKLANQGFPICFDIGHTLAQYITTNKEKLLNYLYQSAKKMARTVGLIHITTNAPPFNGTDSHDGILEEDFKQGVVPNKQQLIKLLKLFKKNKDIWLIPEPETKNMIKNYFALKKILSEI